MLRLIKNYLIGLGLLLLVYLFTKKLEEQMEPKRFEAKQWVISLLLLGAALMLLTCDLSAQTVRATKVDDIGPYGGITKCDEKGNIEILVSTRVPPYAIPEVMIHEAVHVLQIRRHIAIHGSCKEAHDYLVGNLHLLMAHEVEAYCVDINLSAQNRNQILARKDWLASFLWNTNHGNFTEYERFKNYINEVCSRPSPNVPVVRFISSEGAVALFDISHRSPIPPVQQDGTIVKPP